MAIRVKNNEAEKCQKHSYKMKKRKNRPSIKNNACKRRGCYFTGFDLMKARTFETVKQNKK